jgi:hypothetical protein
MLLRRYFILSLVFVGLNQKQRGQTEKAQRQLLKTCFRKVLLVNTIDILLMKLKQLTVLLLLLLSPTLLTNLIPSGKTESAQTIPSLYFGVDVAFENLTDTLQIIDKVSSYTNLFIIGCYGPVTPTAQGRPVYNQTRLNVISEYVYGKGLSFIVYSDDPGFPSKEWLDNASAIFGNKFLGIYYYDEPGGKQLDQANYPAFYYAKNFSDAADRYVRTVNWWLRSGPFSIAKNFDNQSQIQLFTSDYGLYWYDFQAGYDTVFAEYGWNSGWEAYSRQLNAALVRGAATVLKKDWGIMITWAYNEPPYMEPGPQLYNDMVSAYENGAKYIIIFDSNKNWTQNVLTQDQFDAMKQFWQYAQENPRTGIPVSDRSVYVLPEDYGDGFRSPNDTIWGLWDANYNVAEGSSNFTSYIKMSVATLLQMFGPSLDIVYHSVNQTVESVGYKNVLYWNDTRLLPDSPSMPPQKAAGNESAWQLKTPTSKNPPSFDPNLTSTYAAGICISVFAAVSISVLRLRKNKKSNSEKL